MSSTLNRGVRLGAMGAAAALAIGGLVVAPAAAAEDAPTASLDQIAAEVFGTPGVTAVSTDGQSVFIKLLADGEDGNGGLVSTTSEEKAEATAQQIAAKYANVEIVENVDPVEATDASEVVGGAGYVDDQNYLCSVGFSAWSPSGDPAVITAGHCSEDLEGTQTYLTVPSQEPGHTGAEPGTGGIPYAELGVRGHWHFGDPNATSYTIEEIQNGQVPESALENTTDVAVIDDINPELTTLPEVTDWSTAGQDDLAASTTPVTGVASAQIGDTIHRSGRSTGERTGTVVEEQYTFVGDPTTGQYKPVHGYLAQAPEGETLVAGGDSGGAVMVGSTAVGIVSGGGENEMFFADLPEALGYVEQFGPGEYSVALDLVEPEVTKSSSVRDGSFEGTAPANSTVTITGDIEGTFDADADGVFTFPAPNKVGSFDITLQAKKGYDVSETVDATVKTTQIQVDAPVITSPEDGSSTTSSITEITGTGMPGAEVSLTGSVEDTATVADDGSWSVETKLGLGNHEVTAVQTYKGVESDATTSSFTVALSAPTITTPEDGANLSEAVTEIAGTGKPGAEVTLSGDAEGTATVAEDGSWSVEADLGFGSFTVSAMQSQRGFESKTTSASFQVVPSAPTIVTPEDGGSYEEGELTAVIGESSVEGASVTVTIEGDNIADLPAATVNATGAQSGEFIVEGGAWIAEFNEQLPVGAYTVSASQSIDGVSSESVSVSFEVVGAAAGGGGDEGDEGDNGAGNEDEGDGDELAATGADMSATTLPLAGGAAFALIAGVALLAIRRAVRA